MQKPVKMSANRKEEADKADSSRQITWTETEKKKKKKKKYDNMTVKE